VRVRFKPKASPDGSYTLVIVPPAAGALWVDRVTVRPE
jgi:hypothetical protein